MNLGLRARAAVATLSMATFAFNPHQKRGPDGRFIKMADHELKRPRRNASRAKTAARPALDAPYHRRRDALARSVRSGVAGETPLGQGVMGETRRYELNDGTSAIYKRAHSDLTAWNAKPAWTRKDQQDAEELGAITAAALDVRAPAVHRTADDELYMDLMPGEMGVQKLQAGVSPFKIGKPDQRLRLGLLDMLTDNQDRNMGNFLVDDDDNLYAIDHGLAFSTTHRINEAGQVEVAPVDSPDPTSLFALPYMDADDFGRQRYAAKNPLHPTDVAKIHERLARIRPQFKRLGRLDWYNSMVKRMTRLAAGASGNTPLY